MDREQSDNRPPEFFRIGQFLIRPRLKAIRPFKGFDEPSNAEQDRRLADKPMAVLLILAERPRKVCTREFLLDEVWGSDREAYDRVLDNAISDLRRAFKDNPRRPEYIETITKQGYRLIAEVEWPDASSPPLPPVKPREADGERGVGEGTADSAAQDAAGRALGIEAPDAPTPTAAGSEAPRSAGGGAGRRESRSGKSALPGPERGERSPATPRAPGGVDRAPGSEASGSKASGSGRVSRTSGGDSGSRVSSIRERPWWRQLGIFGFLLVVLFATAGWVLMQLSAGLQVHIGTIIDRSGHASFGDLERRLVEKLEAQRCEGSLIDLRNLSFLSNTRVRGSITEDRGELTLSVTVSGLSDSRNQPLLVKGSVDGDRDQLVSRLADEILYALDRELCPVAKATQQAVGCHCERAGRRDDAEGLYKRAKIRLDKAAQGEGPRLSRLEARDTLVELVLKTDGAEEANRRLQRLEEVVQPADEVELLRLERRRAQVDWDAAAEQTRLEQLELASPRDPRWPLQLAHLAWSQRRACRESLAGYRDAAAYLGPELEASLGFEALIQLSCGATALEALSTLRELKQRFPGSPGVLVRSAELLRMIGQYARAGEHLTEAQQIEAEHPEARLQLGRLDLARGLLRSAKKHFRQYASLTSGRRGVHDGEIGQALAELAAGEHSAVESLAASAESRLEEKTVEPAWVRGLSKAAQGQLEEARAEVRNVEKILEGRQAGRGRLLLLHLRGEIALAAGEAADASRYFQDALFLWPADRPFFLHALARSLAAEGEPRRALGRLDELFAINPHHAPALCTAGTIRQELGEVAEAKKLYRRAFDSWNDQPSDAPMRACLARYRAL